MLQIMSSLSWALALNGEAQGEAPAIWLAALKLLGWLGCFDVLPQGASQRAFTHMNPLLGLGHLEVCSNGVKIKIDSGSLSLYCGRQLERRPYLHATFRCFIRNSSSCSF